MREISEPLRFQVSPTFLILPNNPGIEVTSYR